MMFSISVFLGLLKFYCFGKKHNFSLKYFSNSTCTYVCTYVKLLIQVTCYHYMSRSTYSEV